MKRFQLFEVEDQSWFPSTLRNYMTDFLRTVAEKFNMFGPTIPLLTKVLKAGNEHLIVDIASGGGGQWRTLLPQLAAEVPNVQVTLTDFYPNEIALKFVENGLSPQLQIETTPIDARNIPDHLTGLRTMYLSLHHFTPDQATAIIQNAVSSHSPIAFFEAQQRDVKHLLQFCFSPLMVLVLTPFIRPFKPGRFLFTYLFPIIPVVTFWDGVVSVLRTYTPKEMQQMAQKADPDHQFNWEAGVIDHGQQKIQYMIGQPK